VSVPTSHSRAGTNHSLVMMHEHPRKLPVEPKRTCSVSAEAADRDVVVPLQILSDCLTQLRSLGAGDALLDFPSAEDQIRRQLPDLQFLEQVLDVLF